MADFSPHAGSPIAIKALVASLLVTSGVQAWQLMGEQETAVAPADVAVPAVFLNLTAPQNPDGTPSREPAQPEPAAPSPPPAEPSAAPPPPSMVTVAEKPHYVAGVDFSVEALVSATPLTYTPWTGTGVPYILVFYDGLNDTKMLHNAYLFFQGGTGYDVCTHGLIRFWDWVAVETGAPGTRLLYQSQPVPQNLLNLAGSGENCYTRALIESSWKAEACMEGDGELAKPSEETLEDGTIVRHVDMMDYCAIIQLQFP